MSWQEDVQNALNEIAGAITGGELAVTLSAPIEADIVDADMTALTGGVSLADLGGGATLADLDMNLGTELMAVNSNLNDGMSVADHLAVIDNFASTGIPDIVMAVDAVTAGGSASLVDVAMEVNMGLNSSGIGDTAANWLETLVAASIGPSPLISQMIGAAGADILESLYTNDAGSVMSGPSPLFDGTGGTSIGDHLLNIYGKVNTMESNIAAMKAQTDKLTFDGSNHLEVHTN